MMKPSPAEVETRKYNALPTLELFHRSTAQIRGIVGPVGSGKTSAAALEVGYYLPWYLFEKHRISKTRFVVVRNTYPELRDTTMRTVDYWFPGGIHHQQKNTFDIRYENGIEVELLFRSCDNPEDMKKFKSLEVTGYWIDESIEVAADIKRMLKTRIGRFPAMCPVRYGIETTNPPDVEHPTYSEFKWVTPVPGPVSEKTPLDNHIGFWQPPRENESNLRPEYYDDLIRDYRDNPDWVAMYVQGKPGIIQKGKLVYVNFRRDLHVAREPLVWNGMPLIRMWDNSGNTPAALVGYIPTPGRFHILKEYVTDRDGIVDFTKNVVESCNLQFPDGRYTDYGDPAGANKFSKKEGGFTSNAELMREATGVFVISSDQNFTARTQAVEQQLSRIDGILIDPSCTRLINGFLGGYCYPELGNTGIYGLAPVKNRFSHVHDALQYGAVKIFKSVKISNEKSYDFDEQEWLNQRGKCDTVTGYG